MDKQQKFFELLKYSNKLRKNKKCLREEDFETFIELLHLSVIIEGNLHYLEKQKYIELAKDFLANQITADDFSYSFMALNRQSVISFSKSIDTIQRSRTRIGTSWSTAKANLDLSSRKNIFRSCKNWRVARRWY